MAWPGTILTIKIIKEIELAVPWRQSFPVNNFGIAVAQGSLGQAWYAQARGTECLGGSCWPHLQPTTPAPCCLSWRCCQQGTAWACLARLGLFPWILSHQDPLLLARPTSFSLVSWHLLLSGFSQAVSNHLSTSLCLSASRANYAGSIWGGMNFSSWEAASVDLGHLQVNVPRMTG